MLSEKRHLFWLSGLLPYNRGNYSFFVVFLQSFRRWDFTHLQLDTHRFAVFGVFLVLEDMLKTKQKASSMPSLKRHQVHEGRQRTAQSRELQKLFFLRVNALDKRMMIYFARCRLLPRDSLWVYCAVANSNLVFHLIFSLTLTYADTAELFIMCSYRLYVM